MRGLLGFKQLTSLESIPGQFVWNLWRTKWPYDRFYSDTSVFSASIIPPILHSHNLVITSSRILGFADSTITPETSKHCKWRYLSHYSGELQWLSSVLQQIMGWVQKPTTAISWSIPPQNYLQIFRPIAALQTFSKLRLHSSLRTKNLSANSQPHFSVTQTKRPLLIASHFSLAKTLQLVQTDFPKERAGRAIKVTSVRPSQNAFNLFDLFPC